MNYNIAPKIHEVQELKKSTLHYLKTDAGWILKHTFITVIEQNKKTSNFNKRYWRLIFT